MGVRVRRVYDEVASEDGVRVLVDRLWPRGLSKERAAADVWLREVAPSSALRRRFHAGEVSFEGFAAEYRVELSGCPALAELRGLVAGSETVTLLTAARSPDRSHVAVLVGVLDASG